MQENIAKTISRGWSPELTKAMELPERARRLDRALKVSMKWMEDAREQSAEMWAQAEYTRDKVEEELSRVCFEMDVSERVVFYCEDATSDDEEAMRAAAISDALLEAYLILRDAPEDLFPPVRSASPGRGRYELMGTLMVALDAADKDRS